MCFHICRKCAQSEICQLTATLPTGRLKQASCTNGSRLLTSHKFSHSSNSERTKIETFLRSWLTNRRRVLLICFLLSLSLLLLPVLTHQQYYSQFPHYRPAAHQRLPHNHYPRDNRTIAENKPEIAARAIRLNRRRAVADDPEVVQLAGDVIDSPSTSSDWLSRNTDISYPTPQASAVDRYLRHKTNGFFVECGAFDGHHSSNTAWLEKVRNWTGLLIEMDPFLYTQLRNQHRQAYGVNACLSPVAYVSMMRYRTVTSCDQCSRLMIEDYESGNAIPRSPDTGISANKSNAAINRPTALCLPFESLLLALKRTQIDYFSLDVEGLELDILRTIPWKIFNIRMISVEYDKLRRGNKHHLVNYMRANGYGVVYSMRYVNHTSVTYVNDYIFVRHNQLEKKSSL